MLTGMRSGELYALTWKKIDFKSQILHVYDNWTRKEDVTPAALMKKLILSQMLRPYTVLPEQDVMENVVQIFT